MTIFEKFLEEQNLEKKYQEFADKYKKYFDTNITNLPDYFKINYDKIDYGNEICLHKQCSQCNGTGINKMTGAMCIHMISCPCSRCSPRC